MFTALNTFGFGLSFCSWIKNLYASPTNKVVSTYFTEVEDRCPSSTLLSDIAIEALAAAVRSEAEVKAEAKKNHPNPISKKCWHYTLLQIRDVF